MAFSGVRGGWTRRIEGLADWGALLRYLFLGKAKGGMGRRGKRRESACDCERRLISVRVEMLEKFPGE